MDPWEDLKNELEQWHKTGVFSRALIAARKQHCVFRSSWDLKRYEHQLLD